MKNCRKIEKRKGKKIGRKIKMKKRECTKKWRKEGIKKIWK